MATLLSPRKKLLPSEYEATPMSLRLSKVQRSFLSEKKRKSPLYNEQKYLRKLIDIGMKSVERGDEFQDEQEGTFNPKSATSIAELKNEITREVIEHVRASTKCLADISTIQFDGLSKILTSTRAALTSQMTTGQERQDAMAKILEAMIGETTLAAIPNMKTVSAASEQQCAPTVQKYENLLPTKGNKMISKIQISISEENEQGIRTFTLSGELGKQTAEATLGWHIANLIDSLLRREGNSIKPQPENEPPTPAKSQSRLIKRTPHYDNLDQELIDPNPTLL